MACMHDGRDDPPVMSPPPATGPDAARETGVTAGQATRVLVIDIHRGASLNVDITHQWNFWPLMSLSLREARARLGVLPKLPARA